VRLAFVMTHHHAQSMYRFLTEALGKYLIAHKFLSKSQKAEIVIPDSDAVQNLMVALGEDETRLRRVKQGDWLLIERGVFAPAYTDKQDPQTDPLCYHKSVSALLLHMFFDGNIADTAVDRIVVLSRFANAKDDDCNVNTCLLNGEELISAIKVLRHPAATTSLLGTIRLEQENCFVLNRHSSLRTTRSVPSIRVVADRANS